MPFVFIEQALTRIEARPGRKSLPGLASVDRVFHTKVALGSQ
ncbi:hypothetical protein CLOLEP_02030 [[Clostridium] leptum DSM 753]|uniref:Uncharacterized protein n=1 Tax=[Clostridium] leptum DSM 753 TaxID=428125 RepID=A7VTY5_9FIRM|nr:hypothetical protein CLOLEP_02030 [[Clostridium] leptum DSM 753]